MVAANLLFMVPAGILFGHFTIQGTRCPPSKLVPFPSLKPPADPACSPKFSQGPLLSFTH